jgi:hypothetical protein
VKSHAQFWLTTAQEAIASKTIAAWKGMVMNHEPPILETDLPVSLPLHFIDRRFCRRGFLVAEARRRWRKWRGDRVNRRMAEKESVSHEGPEGR